MTLKNITLAAPIIAAFLIFNGILKLDIYYSNFNINIVEYLDFSEVLLSFLDDVNFMVLCAVGGFIQALIYTFFIIHSSKTQVANNDTESGERALSALKDFLTKLLATGWKGVYLSAIFGAVLFFVGYYFSLYGLIFVALIFICQMFIYLINICLPFLSLITNAGFSISITIILLTVNLALIDSERISELASEQVVKIETNDVIYKTGNGLYRIGQVKNYTFLYDEKEKETTIIPNKEIIGITIKQK